jgi:uracil DNA glycosylase superfamily protein
MKTFAEKIIHFYKTLNPPGKLPRNIDWLFPQKDKIVFNAIESFYNKYYYDNNQRSLIFGINPGRFGAGTTGINFTAPKQLKQHCEIAHSFKNQTELSAEFIYEMIIAYGGCNKFYGDFIISAVSPLGFIKNGKNLNYYDDKELQYAVTPFIIDCINKQTKWKVNREKCFCIGGEKNFKFLYALNEKHKWLKEIIPLPHPRFIMQYRRKQKQKFIDDYLQALVNP